MIHWLNPGALGGLGLLALPVVIHLLRTRVAERIPFPSLRFVMAARTAAVRFRPPADWLLLLVRLAIVTAAVAAVAAPVIVTASRIRVWNARIVRAVILDTTTPMSAPDASGRRPLDAAREAAAAEVGSATQVAQIEGASVRDSLVRAASWLSHAPPARREIVVISAFIDGTLRERDVGAVPTDVGLRFVRVGAQVEARHLAASKRLDVPGAPAQTIDTELSGPQTRVRLTREPARQSGLTILGADPQSPAAQGLWRAVAVAGAPAPSPDEPLVCVFGSETTELSASPIGPATSRWILRTLIRLQTDDELRHVSNSTTGAPLAPSDLWTVVAVDRNGDALVRVSSSSGQLLMQIGAPPESFLAAAAVRALLMARAGDGSRPDLEILRSPAEALSAWSRPAAEVDREAWRRAAESDGRWLWLAAVALLGLEQRLRRSASREPLEVRDAA
jgi:hypothetical protein